jgi:hypothetical protein
MLSDPAPNEDGFLAESRADALVAALIDLERHVGAAGWDQTPRLFALVRTDDLVAAEPALAAELGLRTAAEGAAPEGLTGIEQEQFAPTGDVVADLALVVWPEAVTGCALSLESSFLPAGREAELPDDPEAAAAAVAAHPDRVDVRLVVGVDRYGHQHGVGRLVSAPEELLGAPDLVPGLVSALAHTLS